MKFATKNAYLALLLSPLLLQADIYTNPSTFDLRNVDGKSYINDVKDQSPYGTCYSFGATSAAEGSYNYTMNLYGKNRSSFSETFIIWSLGQKYEGFPMDSKGDGGLNTYDYL
ncbi:MAG: hypothetical protein GX780_07535 [Campylobacteraceae bacterium]|nr:hypothetical protein [Campylobacteraceae bacterium]